MTEVVKKHPLRDIILNIDSNVKPLVFEQKALWGYEQMHHRTYEIKTELKFRSKRLHLLEYRIGSTFRMAQSLEQDIRGLQEKIEKDDTLQETPDIGAEIQQKVQWTLEFYKTLEALHQSAVEEMDAHDKYADFIYEHESWIDDSNSKRLHEVFRRYKEVAVDIVSLDRDQEEFFGVYAKIKKLEKTYFELAARVFDDYHELHLFMDSVYDQAEALEKGYEEKNK